MSARLNFTITIPPHLMGNQETNLQSNASTTQATTNYQWIPIVKTYTGTKDQPDVVTVFFKSNGKDIYFSDEESVNQLGHSPMNFLTALLRIKKAAKILSQKWKQGTFFKENSESWNAFKNLSRGVIQLIPLIGNAILYIHDAARIHLSVRPKIKSALSNQEEPVVGLAFDGTPVFTVPISALHANYESDERTPNERLALVTYLWVALRKRSIENNSTSTTRELAETMRQMLINYRSGNSTTTR